MTRHKLPTQGEDSGEKTAGPMQRLFRSIIARVVAAASRLGAEFTDPAKRISWILITPATMIVVGILSVIETGTSRQAIYPTADQRVDIDRLYGARLADVCPAADADPRRASFEECLKQIKLSQLSKFSIPKFAEIGETPPDMPSDLATSKDPKQRAAARIFAPNSAFVIAVPIPSERITIDGDYWTTNDHGERRLAIDRVRARPMLTFRGMRFGTVCIEGRCDMELNASTMGANTIPLVWRSAPATDDRFVWLFGLEGGRSTGLKVNEGMLIADAKNLLKTVAMYAMLQVGGQIRMAQNFIALFVIALVFSLLHRSFPDYAAFAGLAAAIALWTGFLPLGIMLPWLRGPAHHAGFFWAWGNVLTMSIVLILSLRRQKALLVPSFLIGQGLSIAGGGFMWFLARSLEISEHWGKISASFIFTMILVCLYLLSDQVLITQKLEREVGAFGRRSTKLNYRWRLREAWMHLAIWILLVFPMGVFAWRVAGSGLVQQFSSIVLWGLFPMLGVMLYFMYSKQKTRLKAEPHGEALRLQLLLPAAEFEAMMEQPRQGVVLLLDIAGSTGRDAKKKGPMMQRLLNQAARDLEQAGSYIELPTTGGDEWRIVTGLSGSSLAEDLRAKVLLLQQSYPRYLQIVNEALPGCGLHAVVMALTAYSMAGSTVDSDRALPVLDFRGDEADALMGFLGKPKLAHSLLVCGAASALAPALAGLSCLHELTMLAPMVQAKLHSLGPRKAGGGQPEVEKIRSKLSKTLAIADALGLAYVHLPLPSAAAGDAPLDSAS